MTLYLCCGHVTSYSYVHVTQLRLAAEPDVRPVGLFAQCTAHSILITASLDVIQYYVKPSLDVTQYRVKASMDVTQY